MTISSINLLLMNSKGNIQLWFERQWAWWIRTHSLKLAFCHWLAMEPWGFNLTSITASVKWEWEENLPQKIVVQSLSCIQLFVISWTAAHQTSLFSTISQSCPLSQRCCLTISSSAALFSFCLGDYMRINLHKAYMGLSPLLDTS